MIDPSLPLIDLHRHLDGSVRMETILDLGRKYNLPLPEWDLEHLRPHVQVTEPQVGVMAFISKFKWMIGVLADYDACRRIAYENVEDAFLEGIDYIELRFSPWFIAEPHRLDPADVVEAVVEGTLKGIQDFDIQVNLIGILSRTYGPEIAYNELNALLRFKQHLVGLDLAGDEANQPGTYFVEHFNKAREVGWKITVHAGESSGPESVWQAIKDLGATRIGHGIHAVEDPQLMDFMAEKKIGIESNITSNIQTSTVPSYSRHPIRQFLAHGILATINTDDPGISNIDLQHEYRIASTEVGLSDEQLHQAQRNALTLAFLPPQRKRALLKHKQSKSNSNI